MTNGIEIIYLWMKWYSNHQIINYATIKQNLEQYNLRDLESQTLRQRYIKYATFLYIVALDMKTLLKLEMKRC